MARVHLKLPLKKILGEERGQTAIEYIFLLAVIVSVITSILSMIKTKYLGDISKCASAQNQKQLLCKINSIFSSNPDQLDGKRFKYYPFHK